MKDQTAEHLCGLFVVFLIMGIGFFLGCWYSEPEEVTPRQAAVEASKPYMVNGSPTNFPFYIKELSNAVARVTSTNNTFNVRTSHDEQQIYIYQQAIERALKNVTIKTEDVNKWQGGYIHTNGPSFRPNIINVPPDYLHVTP